MMLVRLFLAFFRVGAFATGGTFSFLPLVEKEVVQRYQWLTKQEFLDMAGISNIFPGAISIKYATYTGYKMAGILGAIVANIGNAFVPALLIIFASAAYAKYKDSPNVKGAFYMIELAVFAMIIAVAFQLVDLSRLMQVKGILVVTAALLLFLCTKIHPAIVIVAAGLLGAILK